MWKCEVCEMWNRNILLKFLDSREKDNYDKKSMAHMYKTYDEVTWCTQINILKLNKINNLGQLLYFKMSEMQRNQ